MTVTVKIRKQKYKRVDSENNCIGKSIYGKRKMKKTYITLVNYIKACLFQ